MRLNLNCLEVLADLEGRASLRLDILDAAGLGNLDEREAVGW